MEEEPQEGKDYCEVSNLEAFALLLLVLPIDVVFTEVFDQPFRGFIAALSAAVVLSLIWILRPLARRRKFWGCVFLAAVLHLLLVYYLPSTGDFRFGFALFPLAFGDFYLFARVTIHACRDKQGMGSNA